MRNHPFLGAVLGGLFWTVFAVLLIKAGFALVRATVGC